MKADVVRTLISALGLAVLIVVWLQPKSSLSPIEEGVAFVAVIQLAAFMVARWVTPYNKPRLFIKAVLSAFMFAAVTILVLQPSVSISFDELFVYVTLVELMAIGFAGVLTRSKPVASQGE